MIKISKKITEKQKKFLSKKINNIANILHIRIKKKPIIKTFII